MIRKTIRISIVDNLKLPLTIHRFPSLASTNQTLWELLAQGAKAGTIVISEAQTAGRGQWGRYWESGRGGLYLSVAVFPDWEATHSGELTIATAWGIATVLQNYGIPIQLKAPNDLFLVGKKLGGILTETRIQGGKIITAVIGVGINWSNPVPDVGISLNNYWSTQGINPQIQSLSQLEAVVLEGIFFGYGQLQGKGVSSFLKDYQNLLQ
ncbi:MAG: biotin--[acetyl-CoA-carboxylase] ligase [Coleofasciculaceae cyanobacterium SM2_1_6]|nr:biotin--[acetyl-CoA-carboxylase] ligase [Coleofasciculaceae cyanobacterium SM2_1_6]